MKEIFDEIVTCVKDSAQSKKDRFVHFSDVTYKPFPFDERNFSSIAENSKSKRIVFVDGGNVELVKTPHLSVQQFRVCYCVYQGKKKISSVRSDFYALIHAVKEVDELCYSVRLFNCDFLHEKRFKVSSADSFLQQGADRTSISSMGNVIRRCAELAFSKRAFELLSEGDAVVFDGSLQSTYPQEKLFLEEVFSLGKEKGVAICGLSKTTSMMTDSGNSVVSKLKSYLVEGSWLYYPVASFVDEHYRVELSFVKFHSKSEYIFKFEIFDGQKDLMEDVVSLLCSLSNDAVFLGYPYGLIDVDARARISNSERDMALMYLKNTFGKDWDLVDSGERSLNAHSVLDSIG